MNFADKYKESQKDIAPDAEFIEKLAQKMESEKNAPKKRVKPALFVSAAGTCAAAAAALIIVFSPKGAPADINYAPIQGNADRISYVNGVFGEKDDFGNNTSAVEQLKDILSDGGTVLYKSKVPTFEDEDVQSAEEREALAALIDSAEESSGSIGGGDYYMAVSSDGKILKFRISGKLMELGEKIFELG